MKTLFYSIVAFCSLGVTIAISWAFDKKPEPHKEYYSFTDSVEEYKYKAKTKEAELLECRNQVIEIQERILYKIEHKNK